MYVNRAYRVFRLEHRYLLYILYTRQRTHRGEQYEKIDAIAKIHETALPES